MNHIINAALFLYMFVTVTLLGAENMIHRSNMEQLKPEVDVNKIVIDFSLEGFKVPPIWVQANLSFLVSYEFEIDEKAHPIEIKALQDDYLDKEKVISYMKKWKIVGLSSTKGAKYICVLKWKHMYGWVSMLIYNDNFSLMIKLNKSFPA